MKLLLVEPESPYTAPNLGLLHLSASLAQSRHEALLLDLSSGSETDAAGRIAQIVKREDVGAVGLSVCDVNYLWSLDLVKELKSALNLPVVLGGPQVNSLGPGVLAENPEVDYAMTGECDRSIVSFLDFVAGEGKPKNVPGLVYRTQKSISCVPADHPKDLDNLPRIDYAHLGVARLSGYMLLTSRGCPYKCIFCCRNTGDTWRAKSLDLCLGELRDAVQNLGGQEFPHRGRQLQPPGRPRSAILPGGGRPEPGYALDGQRGQGRPSHGKNGGRL